MKVLPEDFMIEKKTHSEVLCFPQNQDQNQYIVSNKFPIQFLCFYIQWIYLIAFPCTPLITKLCLKVNQENTTDSKFFVTNYYFEKSFNKPAGFISVHINHFYALVKNTTYYRPETFPQNSQHKYLSLFYCYLKFHRGQTPTHQTI